VLPHDSSCWWLDHSHQPYPSMLESQSLPSLWLVTKVQSRSIPGLSLNTILTQTQFFRTLLLGDPRAILSTAKWFKLRNSIHKQVPQNPLHISSIWRTCDLRDWGQILLVTVCTQTLLLSQGTRAEES
jgi:hypothetical protein